MRKLHTKRNEKKNPNLSGQQQKKEKANGDVKKKRERENLLKRGIGIEVKLAEMPTNYTQLNTHTHTQIKSHTHTHIQSHTLNTLVPLKFVYMQPLRGLQVARAGQREMAKGRVGSEEGRKRKRERERERERERKR